MIWHHFVHHLRDSGLWFAGGAVVGTAVERWLPTAWAERWLTRGSAPVFTAAAAGALLPGCALTTVPVAAAFRDKGASVGALAAFLMIAPILSPHTLVLNLALLGWPMTVGRIVLPLAVCIALGLFLNALRFTTPATPLPEKAGTCCGGEKPEPKSCCATEKSQQGHATGRGSFLSSLAKSLRELGPYFLLGLLAVAVVETLVPHETLVRYLSGGWIAHLAAAVAGIPVYVCEGAEIPLTAALVKMGVGPGPAFTFLLASVGTCIPTVAMAPRIIGWVPTGLYITAMLLASVGGGMVMGALLR